MLVEARDSLARRIGIAERNVCGLTLSRTRRCLCNRRVSRDDKDENDDHCPPIDEDPATIHFVFAPSPTAVPRLFLVPGLGLRRGNRNQR